MLFNKNPAYINTERKYVDTNQLFHIIVEHLSQYRQIHFFIYIMRKKKTLFISLQNTQVSWVVPCTCYCIC